MQGKIVALLLGVCFGFLLQKGGVTQYHVIVNQLLLRDWTVVKVILTAVLTGMVGIYCFRAAGWVSLHKKPGSVGSTVIGGLIFGVGFAILGYCPGTLAGAVGQGSMDALLGGLFGMLIGTGIFAGIYGRISSILSYGDFGDITIAEFFKVSSTVAVLVAAGILIYVLAVIEAAF